MRRPSVAFLAWSSVSGRSSEIASVLGGEARCYYDFGIVRRSLVPIRYLASGVRTIGYLASRRPQALIVTNPPVLLAMLVYPYARLARVPFLLDSHPDAFREDSSLAGLAGAHRWLVRRAHATLTPNDELARTVEAWGGRGVVVHEAPPAWTVSSPAKLGSRPRVVVLGTLSRDEPVAAVVDAARQLPHLDFELTGDRRKLDSETLESAPSNVTFVGFLHGRDYVAAIERGALMVVLTIWPDWSVPRAGYEAVHAGRPLVITDSKSLRENFPYAVTVSNDAEAIANGIREAILRHAALVAAADDARAVQRRRWETQLRTLRELIAGDRGGEGSRV